MSQRSTKVRPCPRPGHPPIFPGPAGSSGPAQPAGSRLRVQKDGTDLEAGPEPRGSLSQATLPPLVTQALAGGLCLAQRPQRLGRRKPAAGGVMLSPRGETSSLATGLAHSLARAWHLPYRSEAA